MTCRHIHHAVEPQHHVWKGGVYKRTMPGQVYCRDCGIWLYEKPIDWDNVPLNAIQRREARIADSLTDRPPAQPTDEPRSAGRTHAG